MLIRALLVQSDGLLQALGFQEDLFILLPVPPTSNEEHSEEGEETAADKLCGLFRRGPLKVAVQHRASRDDAEGEHDKLDGDDLGRVEALERLVHVADLHDGRAQEDDQERVRHRSGKGAEKGRGQHRRHALGGENCIAACSRDALDVTSLK